MGEHAVTDSPRRTLTVNPSSPRPMRLDDLKSRIQTSAYVVDTRLVAEAVLRRDGLHLLALPLSRGDARSPSVPGLTPRRPS